MHLDQPSIKETIEGILKRTTSDESMSGDVFVPEHDAFGHYATNSALRLAKTRGKDPMVFAKELAGMLEKAAPKDFFSKVEAAPPGFINFWLAPALIQAALGNIVKAGEKYGESTLGKKKTVIIEYSQPNIAKRMHVGHLRTTIVGDALANIHAAVGYKTVRWNYLGDWGTQFGKLIAAYRLWGSKEAIEKDPIQEMTDLYVRFHDEMKTNPSLEAQGQAEFKKLEQGDTENRALWEWFRKESLKDFERIYALLGVKFDTAIGESFFEEHLSALVADLVKRKIARESEGALVVPLEAEHLPPALIQKSDGASLYLTRDIANLAYRIKKYKPNKILYVVGNEQSLHFAQVFAVAKIVGLTQAECVHVKYGLVLGESGKKLATREGRTILLDDVLEKAVHLAKDIVREKNQDLPDAEQEAVAHAVGVGALKYAILKENRTSDIAFDWGRILDFRGDSAPYLQYTFARVAGIERKASAQVGKLDASLLVEEKELGLIRHLIEFPDSIRTSAETLNTSILAAYLYELANRINRFYEATPILADANAARRDARRHLLKAATGVLTRGLGILGIQTPERI